MHFSSKLSLIKWGLFCLCLSINLKYTFSQSWTTRDPRFYSREGVFDYKPPSPGDPDYRTYTFNDRRYGYYQPNGYGKQYPGQNQPGQYPQGSPLGDDRFKFDPNDPNAIQTPFPGVLGGWREDLQGKLRRDSLQLDRDVFVKTNYGQVQGFKVYLYDDPDPKSFFRPWHSPVDYIKGECSVFLGIPYALPPTFEGRFKPPRPHRGWQLMQAVDFGPACPQPFKYTGATKGIRDMDEDCLYLNIFSPKTGSGVAQKYPVMVYIHGGDFYKGASNTFPAHVLASFYNVVVVSFNYRLGALGFLSTADENSPGNYGILDQQMALRWVYDNVDAFNGDRHSITLFGPGAGAASAGLLMVAPLTRNIVTRVIAESGSATADWALIVDKYRAMNTSRVFGNLMGCSIESSWKLINCLRQGRSFYELGNAEFQPHVGLMAWGPVLDNSFKYPEDDWYDGWRERDWHFLKETPEELIRKGQFNRGLHYMAGVNAHEAAYYLYQNESLGPYYEIDDQFFDQKVREFVLRYNYTLNLNGSIEAIKYMYTYWPDPKNKTFIREKYVDFLSDVLFRAPSDQMAKLLLEMNVPVYLYFLNTTVEGLKLQKWRAVPHNIEHYFLTGAPFMDIEFFPKKERLERNQWTDNDRNMSHFFMKTFSDFARYGNPTPQQVLGLHFDKAINGEIRYLNINTTFNSTIRMNYRQTESAFWTQYIPRVVGVLVPTFPPSTEFWWEPGEPVHIALWTMSAACLFLLVLVVICCILWRNAKRQQDRFYDGDVFINNPDEDRDMEGIDNVQTHPLRSRENIYEFRDNPIKIVKAGDASSIKSPSSIGGMTLTNTTKTGSQSSLRSAISMKESYNGKPMSTSTSSTTITTGNKGPIDKNQKYSQKSLTNMTAGSGDSDRSNIKISNKNLSYDKNSKKTKSKEYIDENLSSPEDEKPPRTVTPVPMQRKSVKTSRTHLIEGIPQTEV